MDLLQSSNRVINRFPPLNNITPFTRVDGWSFLEVLEALRKYIVDTLVIDIDDRFDLVAKQLNEWFGQYQLDHTKLLNDILSTKNEWESFFNQFMIDVNSHLEALNDQAVANLVNNELSKLREALDANYMRRNDLFFFPEDYWNAEIEPVNYKHTMERVIAAADGKGSIIMQSGKEYPITDTILLGNAKSVDIRSSGAEPWIISNHGQSLSNLMYLQPSGDRDQTGGPPAVETLLIESRGIDSNGWLVGNPTGIVPGMICAVTSDKYWYHDPRPGEGSAMKSELHLVTKVEGSRVYFEAPAQDGYSVAKEITTLRFYNPIRVSIENGIFRAELPPIAEETTASIGLRIDFAVDLNLKNVSTENCARTGIYVSGCYRPRLDGGYSKRSNNFYNGYGVGIGGCSFAHITDRFISESRRGVDFTSNRIGVISRNCIVENSRCVGGGKNSRGTYFGWTPTGAAGEYQGGFGSHGGADNCTYRDNETNDMPAPFTMRGRNSYVIGNTHIGRAEGVVWASEGINLYVEGNRVLSNYWGMKDRDPYNKNDEFEIDYYRAQSLVTIYANWMENTQASLTRGQLRIMNNHVETRNGLLRMFRFYQGEVFIEGNYVLVAHPTPGIERYVIRTEFPALPSDATPNWMALWHIGNNAYRMPYSPDTIKLANFSLEGAYMNQFTQNGSVNVTQAGGTLSANPPHAVGSIIRVRGTFEKTFSEIPRVVVTLPGPVTRVNVQEITMNSFVVEATLVEEYNYTLGASYIAVGKMIQTG